MSAAFTVLEPGLATTVQDLGRVGYQARGIPVSGALDPDALQLANALVDNAIDEAGLEIRVAGPTLRVDAGSVRVALVGTSSPLEVLEPSRWDVPAGRSVRLERNAVVRVPGLRESATAYLAVAGGFDLRRVLGSRSTCLRARFGGLGGRALEEGDSLPLLRETVDERAAKELRRPYSLGLPERVRVVLGPQDDHFTESGLNTFLEEVFVVTRQADRMGLRLSGPRLAHASGFNIVSDGIATGAIQVPGDGQPILLLADHQTTGGYPKIATVVSADLPALGRAVPGVQVRFQAISVEEAQAAKQTHSRNLNETIKSIQKVNLNPKDMTSTTLLDKNLISGVVNSNCPN